LFSSARPLAVYPEIVPPTLNVSGEHAIAILVTFPLTVPLPPVTVQFSPLGWPATVTL